MDFRSPDYGPRRPWINALIFATLLTAVFAVGVVLLLRGLT
jgi:hypothetical protein